MTRVTAALFVRTNGARAPLRGRSSPHRVFLTLALAGPVTTGGDGSFAIDATELAEGDRNFSLEGDLATSGEDAFALGFDLAEDGADSTAVVVRSDAVTDNTVTLG